MTQNEPQIELNKNDPDSIYNWVAYKISCPKFRNPIKNYIDENCSTFVDIDENSFEQGQLFNEMNQLIENLLNDVLAEGQLTQEDFLKAAERGMEDKKYKKYFNQLINFQNYVFFKSVMTRRNYQIIQMAEKQMKEENEKQNPPQEERKGITPEIIAQMLENEQNEINEAIKQSLADEDEKRRIAIIEEEELKRAIKQSLKQSKIDQKKKENEKKEEPKKEEPKKEEPKKEEPKKEEPKKEEPKKEEPKKEEPKKEEPKKFTPIISSQSNFQYSGIEKPEEKKKEEVFSPNKGFQLQVSSKAEEFGVDNGAKNIVHESTMPAPLIQEPLKKEEKKIEEEKKPQNIIKNEKKFTNDGENQNVIIEQKKPERITRDFVNIFEEKKLTLAPLANKSNISNPNKPSLKEDVQKGQKDKLKGEIERMNKKNEMPKESASDVIKNSLKQSTMNKNDINNLEDDGGLLIDDDEEEVIFKNNSGNSQGHNIHFGKISIPKDFNDKIPDYDKEKQNQLKEYREKVLKIKKEEREQQLFNFNE